jgi:hypothetical protein
VRRRSKWKQDREGFPANKVRQASPPSVHNSSSKEEEKEGEDKGMPKYVIERDIPGIGNANMRGREASERIVPRKSGL